MKEPIKPWPPSTWEYEARVERRYIYKYAAPLREDDSYEDDDDEDEESEDKDAHLPKKEISKVDLAWLLKQIPDGLTPKDIKIEFGYNANCMAYENQYVNFYYEEKIPARKDELKAAKAKYIEAFKKYEEDLAEYQAFSKAEEIRQTEEKLRRLRGEKT